MVSAQRVGWSYHAVLAKDLRKLKRLWHLACRYAQKVLVGNSVSSACLSDRHINPVPIFPLAILSSHFGWDRMSAVIREVHSELLSDRQLMVALSLSKAILDTPAGVPPIPYSSNLPSRLACTVCAVYCRLGQRARSTDYCEIEILWQVVEPRR